MGNSSLRLDQLESRNNKQVVQSHELNRVGDALPIPTNDDQVKATLRLLQEPITYFGEDKADRRSRLRKLLAEKHVAGIDISQYLQSGSPQPEEEAMEVDEEEYYTPGGEELKSARKFITEYSLNESRSRLSDQKKLSEVPLIEHVKFRRKLIDEAKTFSLLGTQSGFDRPVSAVKFAPNSQLIAAGDWAGSVNIMSLPNLDSLGTRSGHEGKIGGITWHPQATIGQSESELNLATSGVEGDIKLWSLSSQEEVGALRGHEARVCKIDFHPSGRFIGSASFDYTWRLWDVETQHELLQQEGHSKEVFAFKFHPDGSLAGSGGLDAFARIWDLRTARTVMILDGHVREIYAMDFSPNGYQVATASADNSVKVWDIRQTKCIFTIPAHTKMVSDVCFYKGCSDIQENGLNDKGTMLMTASYDRTIKLWNTDNWALIKTLEDPERVLTVDISPDRKYIGCGRWDRYTELWSRDA